MITRTKIKKVVLDFLFKPIRYPERFWVQISLSLFFFIFLFMFLAFYTPFNLNELGTQRYYPSLVYAAITSSVIFLFLAITPIIDRSILKDDHFNNLKLIILMILSSGLIAVANYFYGKSSIYSSTINVHYNYINLLMDIVYFPGILMANLVNWESKKITIIDIPIISGKDLNENDEHHSKMIQIQYQSDETLIEFCPAEFICAFSNQNYAEIYLFKNNEVQRELIRIPFSRLFEQLENQIGIIRPHRTRIINLKYAIAYIHQDGKKLLRLKHISEAIPISRNYPIEKHLNHKI